MIAVYVVGKLTPIMLKSVRFTSRCIEGITEDGEMKQIRYEQVKETKTIERDPDEASTDVRS